MTTKRSNFRFMDEEQLMRMKFLARIRFRKLYRMVVNNLYWLMDHEELYEGDDVMRRIQQVKHKKRSLLSLKDKALFNQPADERTDAECKYIYRIMGDMKCFRRYPTNVKRKLASRMYFRYYGPGRTIVRENQEAFAMYFVVTGDLDVTQQAYDEVLEKMVDVHIADMGAGDTFGDVSLLHNIPRTATVTTLDHCELLMLKADDFNSVLLKTVQKEWDHVKSTMEQFTYFESLDATTTREACVIAKLHSFKRDDIILGAGQGVANHVYFVVKGCVQMIESLSILVTKRGDKKMYKLYEPADAAPVEAMESEMNLEKKWKELFSRHKSRSVSVSDTLRPSDKDTVNVYKSDKDTLKTNPSDEINPSADKSKVDKEEENIENEEKVENEKKVESEKKVETAESVKSESGIDLKLGGSSAVLMEPVECPYRQSVKYSLTKAYKDSELKEIAMKKNVSTYFMQVCLMRKGSTFGFGENMKDRTMIAYSDKVTCLILPRVFLFLHNAANIWTRIQHYLNKKIPTKQQLFKEFVKQQRWQADKNLLISDFLRRSSKNHPTTIHDVPYSIRLQEIYDLCFANTL